MSILSQFGLQHADLERLPQRFKLIIEFGEIVGIDAALELTSRHIDGFQIGKEHLNFDFLYVYLKPMGGIEIVSGRLIHDLIMHEISSQTKARQANGGRPLGHDFVFFDDDGRRTTRADLEAALASLS